MAYKIYQQLESGMAESGLVESSEVGYTQNADINASRFNGKTVAGALDNINNTILSLSSPNAISNPSIRLEYKRHNDNEYNLVYSDTLNDSLHFEKGELIDYKAQYYWVSEGEEVAPTKVLDGSSWEELSEAGKLSNEISGSITDSKTFIITLGKDRQGLIIDKDNMIRPAITTDYSSASLDIVFNKRIYYGESQVYPDTLQTILDLNSELVIDDRTNKVRNFELNLPNDKLFVYTYPKAWGESKIYYGGDNHNNAWVCKTMEVTSKIGYTEEYYVYYCYKGAYKNNQQIIFK